MGALSLIAALILFFGPPSSDGKTSPVTWDPSTGKVIVGDATAVEGGLRVVPDKKLRVATVGLAMETVAARDYAFLHIALEESSPDMSAVLSWTNSDGEKKSNIYPVESKARSSLWIATAELSGWSGDIESLSLLLVGKPGDSVIIRDFSLFPASAWRQLQALYSDLTAYEPWNRAAMNTYAGVTNVSSFYPVPLVISLFLLSLLGCGALVAASRGRVRFNRATVALIFLGTWILLDLAWQYRLLHQVADTYRTFAGVDPLQRQSVGPDAPLFQFASLIKPQLPARGSRIFVASSDLYNGMRVAYYLYPLNVYWSVHAPEVPYDEFLRKGDYVALVHPSTFRFNRHRNFLFAPDRADRPAELVFSDPAGILVRLN